MANIKIRNLPNYSTADASRSSDWLIVAESGATFGERTSKISLDAVAPIDTLSGLIKDNRDNISVVSGNVNTVSGNVNTLSGNLAATGQTLTDLIDAELLEFTTGLNPSNSNETGYFVNGNYRANITLIRGKEYKIACNASSAPLFFTKTPVGGTTALSYQVDKPKDVDGNEIAWGGPLMYFTVPEDIHSNVFYQSYGPTHTNFGGKIHITNALLFDSDQDTSITLDNTGVSTCDTDTITLKASGTEVMSLKSTETKIENNFFVGGNSDLSGDLRVRGDVTVNGNYTQIDTNVATTEQMSVTNDGTGPAIIANQIGGDAIVNFQDDGSSVFYLDNGGLIGLNQAAPRVSLDINHTDAVQVPVGTQAERPTPTSGMLRFNSESGVFEGYYDAEWRELGGGKTIDEDKDTFITPEETPDCDSLDFYTSGIKRAQISSAGDTLLAGDLLCSGDIVAFYSTSDQSLKENISAIQDPIEKINKIHGVEFDWKQDLQLHNSGHDVGVIAQEIEKAIPEAVSTRKNGKKSVEYHKIIPLLIECIHNQEERIKELEKKCQYKA